jgi:hypothetical protein
MEEYIKWLENKIEVCLDDKDLQREHWAFCQALSKYRELALRQTDVMRSRFKKGDIVICWGKGSAYGDKFTVLADTGGLTLLCHKSGGLCIVNNRDDYDYA